MAMMPSTHWEAADSPVRGTGLRKTICGLESWTVSLTDDFTRITCGQCLAKLDEGLENK